MTFLDFLPNSNPGLFYQAQSAIPQLPYGNVLPGQLSGMGSIPRLPTPLSTISGTGALPRLPSYIQGTGSIPTLPRVFAEPTAIPTLPNAVGELGVGSRLPGFTGANLGGTGAIPQLPPGIMNNVDDILKPGVRLGGADLADTLSGTRAASAAAQTVGGPGGAGIVDDLVAGAGGGAATTAGEAAAAGRLATFLKSPMGRGAAIGAGFYAADKILGPQFKNLEAQGGKSELIGRGGEGALKGAGLGAAVGSFIPGVGTLVGAGVGGVFGGALGVLGGAGKAKENSADSILSQLSTSNLFTNDEQVGLKSLVAALKSSGTDEKEIITSLLIPTITQRYQEQAQQQQYVQQVKDFFTQQQQAIQQSSALGQALMSPWIDQMRTDADLREKLVQDAVSNSNYPQTYKDIVNASQSNVAGSTRALADSYQQQLRTAPYYALQQQQAQVLEQLRQASLSQLQPQLAQSSLVQQAAATNPNILAQLTGG